MARFPAWLPILCGALLLAPAALATVAEIGTDDVVVWTVGPDRDGDLHQPATAYDSLLDAFLVAWAQDENDAGMEIWAGAVDALNQSGLIFPRQIDDPAVGHARDVAAAYDPLRKRYLLVWSEDVDAPGAFEIWGRILQSNLDAFGTPFRISRMGADNADPAFDAVDPAVAADGQGGFLVTWAGDDDRNGLPEGTFEIYSRLVRSDRTLVGADNRRVSNVSADGTSVGDALAPALAHYPDTGQYVLVYEADFSSAVEFAPSIYYLILESDGAVSPAAKSTGSANLSHTGEAKSALYAMDPAIAFDSRQRQFLIVWADGGGGLSEGINSRRILDDLTVAPNLARLSEIPTGADQLCIARNPTVSYNLLADAFLAGWSGSSATGPLCPGDREMLVREVDRDGNAVGAAPLVVSNMGSAGPTNTAVSPTLVASRATHATMFLMWSGDPGTVGAFDAYGQFLAMDRSTGVEDGPAQRPRELALRSAPNPFNPRTTVSFALPSAGPVKLTLHDIRGARVRTLVEGHFEAGRFDRTWNGTDDRGARVASGVYFARLEHPSGIRQSKLVLVK